MKTRIKNQLDTFYFLFCTGKRYLSNTVRCCWLYIITDAVSSETIARGGEWCMWNVKNAPLSLPRLGDAEHLLAYHYRSRDQCLILCYIDKQVFLTAATNTQNFNSAETLQFLHLCKRYSWTVQLSHVAYSDRFLVPILTPVSRKCYFLLLLS
jgi:hypothetical protein